MSTSITASHPPDADAACTNADQAPLPSSTGTVNAGRRTTRPIRGGIVDASLMLVGMMPFGVVVGVSAALLGLTDPGTLGSSALLYAGTAEMAGLAQVAAGSAPFAVVATMVIVNARLLLYGAAIEYRFRDQPRWFRTLGPMLLIDQTYAAAVDHGPEQAPAFRRYWLALGLTILAGWTGSIAIGIAVGPVLPSDLPLDSAGIACLLGLLVPKLIDRTALITALAAAAGAVAGLALPAGGGILLATCCGLVAGTISQRKDAR